MQWTAINIESYTNKVIRACEISHRNIASDRKDALKCLTNQAVGVFYCKNRRRVL